MLELWFSNQDGSDGFAWPSGAVSDQAGHHTLPAPLGSSAYSPTSHFHCPLPPHFQHRSWILPKEAVQLLGFPQHSFILGKVSSL